MEQPVRHRVRDARPGVHDGNLDVVRSRGAGLDAQFAPVPLLHGLAGVAHQVDQDLLNLNAVGQDGRDPRIHVHARDNALLPGPDQGQRAGLLDQARDGLDPLLGLAAGDELAQRRMICPARKACSAALSSTSTVLATFSGLGCARRRLQPLV